MFLLYGGMFLITTNLPSAVQIAILLLIVVFNLAFFGLFLKCAFGDYCKNYCCKKVEKKESEEK